MSKTKISQYDAIPGNNTDIDGINLAEGMAPGLVNNAIRELMSQLKEFQVGSAGDSLTVGGNLVVSGTGSLSGRAIDAFPSGTKMLFQQTSAPVGWVKDTTHNNKALRVVTGTVSSGGTVGFSSAFVSKAVTGTIANTTAGGTVGGTALSTAQIPSHTHTGGGTTSFVSNDHVHGFSGSGSTGGAGSHAHGVSDPGHAHNYVASLGGPPIAATGGSYFLRQTTQATAGAFTGIGIQAVGDHAHSVSVSGTTGGISANHNHTFSFTTSSTGSGSAHDHSFTGTAHNHTFTGTAIDLAVQYVDVIICTKS